MEEKYFNSLNTFYQRLHNNLLRDRIKIKKNSILWTLMGIVAKKSINCLKNSSIAVSSIPSDVLVVLEELGYIIQYQDNISGEKRYTITALGIWEFEKTKKNYSEEELLSFIQESVNFKIETLSPNNDDLLTIFSMVCLRCFSKDTSMDLKTDFKRKNWEMIFREAFSFLKENNTLKKGNRPIEDLFSSKKIDYFMSHRNNLQKISNDIYRNLNDKRYYLNIIDKNEINQEKLMFLLSLVFKDIPDIIMLDKITTFCINTANNMATLVLDNYKYINAHFDDIIKKALKDIYINN